MASKRARASGSSSYDRFRFISAYAEMRYNEEPIAVVMLIIREFFANVKKHHNGSILVRGKFVPFTVDAITTYFEIPDDMINEYFILKLDYEEIINYLCKGNEEWKLFKGSPLSFKSNKLHGVWKCWF
ncbi:Uncharacterized protein TCM_038855 [Theobroma cacao]|uniref:Uncharacterized protein n=1 Tax=Theobroma cacao TaxID=3641 RepID=A0A061GQS2_THECC|nr:Uncharacterized protein TCM_038855 [Theobroma cacao]